MKTIDVLCFGSCVIDQRDTSSALSLGGDAANQSLVLKRLGYHPVLCAGIGQDEFGIKIIELMHQYDLSADALIQKPEWHTTHSLIHLNEHNDRSFKVTGGAHRLLEKKDFPFHLIKESKALSLGSLFTLHLLEEDGLVEILKEAKISGCLVFSDTSTDRHHKGLSRVQQFLPYIDYFMPSYEEAVSLTKKTDPDEIAEVLFEHGANRVIIKLGAEGATYYDSDQKIHVDAFPACVVDTTGAGDHFCAGFIASILSDFNEKQALFNACYLGARATEAYGTNNTVINQLPYPLEKTNS